MIGDEQIPETCTGCGDTDACAGYDRCSDCLEDIDQM